MKITAIEVTNLRFTYPKGGGFHYAGGVATGRVTSLVRVETDEGITGLGAAYSHPELIRIIIEGHLRPHLLGRNPLQTDKLWELMYGLTRWYGRKGAAVSALGALDIAFWDIRGKEADKPIFKILGTERNLVPAYASGLLWRDDVDDLEKEAARHMRNGFRRVKMRLGRSAKYDKAAVEAVRRGVGQEGDILVDGSHRYAPETALRMGKFLARHNVFWFEEPFPPEDIDSYVALRPKLSIPLAAGENEFGVQGFRELLRADAVDIVQPDASRTGGITECLRIGRLAAAGEVRVAPHTWSDAVALTANAHVVAALENSVTVEVDQTGNPFIEDLLAKPLDIKEGLLTLSDRPGLGIELNPQVVARLTMREEQHVPDGNYSDMAFGARSLSIPPSYDSRQ